MQLTEKIRSVNRLFSRLDNHVEIFREKAWLACIPGCGKCCFKPDINATILEFLPAAQNMYQSGVYEDILIDMMEKKRNSICVFYNPDDKEGHCSCYMYRGLICRLFGFAGRINEYGEKSLVTCKEIRKQISQSHFAKQLSYAPEITKYYMKLFSIDPNLSMQQLSVNECIKKAIEIVALDYRYRRKPA